MKFNLLIALLSIAAICPSASAKTYKWVDDHGVTHIEQTIPPEYANKDRKTLNKSGTVVRSEDVLTAEERRAKESEAAKSKAESDAVRDQKRHDKSLISTYSSIDEIELSRQRNIQQLETRIAGIQAKLKITSAKLAGLAADFESRKKAGQKIPGSLYDDLSETQNQLNRLKLDLDKYNAEKQQVDARFEADKVRYRELTGK
ncbi:MAG: DUF4124 domain-containing protein [Gallionella sp.]|nr:DUF4124 domain-containing protein [Gallionella sp.]MDD4945339.1 DUF4124 domain-containing protein [Gallionella sp.]MDD5611760.1 DUF4124 domain-containing protein [Gallionella sp.]